MVDSNDRERVTEAGNELHRIFSRFPEQLGGKSILVFANKQDLPQAMNVVEVFRAMRLDELGMRGCPWWIQPCCATTGEGVLSGLEWLQAMISQV